jgi:hypothetical protein
MKASSFKTWFCGHVVRFRRERGLTPDGRTVIAPLPSSVNGHFGAELRRFVLVQYHQGQVTVPRLVGQLPAIGIDVSKRQVMRMLISCQEPFVAEARDVLRAGLATVAWTSVDDTGARHKGSNGTCTQIGNDHFTWFGTTGSKSRLKVGGRAIEAPCGVRGSPYSPGDFINGDRVGLILGHFFCS